MWFIVSPADTPDPWEIAAAAGSILGAMATTAAVVAALVVGARDRRAADAAVRQQLDAARVRQEAEHAEARRARRQEHTVGLLLHLNDQVAGCDSAANDGVIKSHLTSIRGVLLALPLDDERLTGLGDWNPYELVDRRKRIAFQSSVMGALHEVARE